MDIDPLPHLCAYPYNVQNLPGFKVESSIVMDSSMVFCPSPSTTSDFLECSRLFLLPIYLIPSFQDHHAHLPALTHTSQSNQLIRFDAMLLESGAEVRQLEFAKYVSVATPHFLGMIFVLFTRSQTCLTTRV